MATFALARLFIRHGVPAVRQAYRGYRERMAQMGTPEREIAVAVVHHANLKINQLKAKTLAGEGIRMPMPWVLSEFGNCSAASPMIAFLRVLPELRPGDHVLFDGFGAGTYYDVVVAELNGRQS
jgi:3-oxoacyl-[acyl-carrier-protein] synthase III